MAIFSKLILASALLSSLALAAPFRGPAAYTVTETDYTTIDTTTTIYIDDSKTMSGAFQPTFAPHASISSSAPPEASSTSVVSTAPAPTFAAPVPSTTMSTSSTPAASPASFFTVSSSSTPAPTPAAVMPSSFTSTTSAAAATSSATLDKNAGTGAPSGASDSASCQGETAACQGDITYYGGGLGACGVNVDPAGNGIALPYEFMGTASNDNPYCGKTLTIYNPATGNTAQATVMDKCMGCTGRSIDLTPALFNTLTNNDEAAGRVSGVDWWFN